MSAPSEGGHADRQLGRYRLRFKIAQGGMASVFLAEYSTAGGFRRWVAVKVMHRHLSEDHSFIAMFLDEARLASRIQHPNVCQVLDFGEQEGEYYIVMEYLRGETLSSLIKRTWRERGPIAPGLVAAIIADVARGLHSAHELRGPDGQLLDVVHRDVSPQNMMVLYDGPAKITDFGIARSRSRMTSTQTGVVKGKFSYMSPEQLNGGTVDRRSDVWALGVVLWEASTGERLFRARSEGETALRVVNHSIARPSEVRDDYPEKLADVVMTALVREPDERIASAGELAAQLEEYLRTSEAPWGPSHVGQHVSALFADKRRERESMLAVGHTNSHVIELDEESQSTLGSKVVTKAATPSPQTSPAMPTPSPADEFDQVELSTVVDPEAMAKALESSASVDSVEITAPKSTPEVDEDELPTALFDAQPFDPPTLHDAGPPIEEESKFPRWLLIAAVLALSTAMGLGGGLALFSGDGPPTADRPDLAIPASGGPTQTLPGLETGGTAEDPPAGSADTEPPPSEPGSDEQAAAEQAVAEQAAAEQAAAEQAAADQAAADQAAADQAAAEQAAADQAAAEQAAAEQAAADRAAAERAEQAATPPRSRPERPRPVGEGTLNLMVIPRAEVLLGRRSLGTTPLVNVRLPAGRHRLTVRAVDGSASRRVTVTIQANQRTRESLRL